MTDQVTARFSYRLNFVARFVLALFFLNLVAALVWESRVEGRVYYCSDEVGFGYLSPGDWVHDPIISEDFRERQGTMSDPDLIRKGWSEAHLWWLWFGFVALTVLLSGLFGRFGFDIFQVYRPTKNDLSKTPNE